MWLRYKGVNARWYRHIGHVQPGDEREIPERIAGTLMETEPDDWEAVELQPPTPKKEG